MPVLEVFATLASAITLADGFFKAGQETYYLFNIYQEFNPHKDDLEAEVRYSQSNINQYIMVLRLLSPRLVRTISQCNPGLLPEACEGLRMCSKAHRDLCKLLCKIFGDDPSPKGRWYKAKATGKLRVYEKKIGKAQERFKTAQSRVKDSLDRMNYMINIMGDPDTQRELQKTNPTINCFPTETPRLSSGQVQHTVTMNSTNTQSSAITCLERFLGLSHTSHNNKQSLQTKSCHEQTNSYYKQPDSSTHLERMPDNDYDHQRTTTSSRDVWNHQHPGLNPNHSLKYNTYPFMTTYGVIDGKAGSNLSCASLEYLQGSNVANIAEPAVSDGKPQSSEQRSSRTTPFELSTCGSRFSECETLRGQSPAGSSRSSNITICETERLDPKWGLRDIWIPQAGCGLSLQPEKRWSFDMELELVTNPKRRGSFSSLAYRPTC